MSPRNVEGAKRYPFSLMKLVLCALALTFAANLRAQADDEFPPADKDSLSGKRRFELMQQEPDPHDLNLGGRIFFVSVEYAPPVIVATAKIVWTDGAKPIPGMVVNAKLQVKDEKQSTKYIDVEDIKPGTGKTDARGWVTMTINLPSERGLVPGEYLVVGEMVYDSQPKSVQDAMPRDPTIYPKDPDDPFLARNPSKRAQMWRMVTKGDTRIPVTSLKLYVGATPADHWLDDGIFHDFQELKQRSEQPQRLKDKKAGLEKKLKDGKDDNGKPATEQQLTEWRLELDGMDARIELAEDILDRTGGATTDADRKAVEEAKKSKKNALDKLDAFDDTLVTKYIHIVEGDFVYWKWKISDLYGVHIDAALRKGKMPWEEPALKLPAATEAEWKKYLKQRIEARCKGNPNPPKDQKRTAAEFSEKLRTMMLADVEAFKIEDFIAKNAGGKYELNEARWIEFEQQILDTIHFFPDSAEALQFHPFGADAKTQPQTTGDRVRALDVSIEYGHRPSRFPMALAALNEGFVQLAYLPKIYRYTWYSDREIMNLPGAKALEQMGDSKAFPVAVQHFAGIAINKISHKVTRGDSEVKIGLKKSFSASKLERVSYTSHPIYALWFYSVGGGRHYPPEAKKDGEDKAKKEMAERRADVLK